MATGVKLVGLHETKWPVRIVLEQFRKLLDYPGQVPSQPSGAEESADKGDALIQSSIL